eukprot:UN25785
MSTEGLKIDTNDSLGSGSGSWNQFIDKSNKSDEDKTESSRPAILNLEISFDAESSEGPEPLLSPTGTLDLNGLKIRKGVTSSKKTTKKKYFVKDGKELKVLDTLGSGFGGTVKKCKHKATGTLMAVKCVSMDSSPRMKQFEKEIKTLMELGNHPNIVKLYGATVQKEEYRVLLALEYMDYGSLEDLLKTRKTLSEQLLSQVAGNITNALVFIHDHKRIHRDIKPGNILINSNLQCKLGDFSMTTHVDSTIDSAKSQVT